MMCEVLNYISDKKKISSLADRKFAACYTNGFIDSEIGPIFLWNTAGP